MVVEGGGEDAGEAEAAEGEGEVGHGLRCVGLVGWLGDLVVLRESVESG